MASRNRERLEVDAVRFRLRACRGPHDMRELGRRMVDKWLKARVLEDGELRAPESGTPQGGVISPLLANIYLHHVVDLWWTREASSPRRRCGCAGATASPATDFGSMVHRAFARSTAADPRRGFRKPTGHV